MPKKRTTRFNTSITAVHTLDINLCDLVSLEIWDRKGLLAKEKELGVRIDLK
jgi:hypothetical protein